MGYFPKEVSGKTPNNVKGFILACDILSKCIYVEILYRSKKSDSMISCFRRLLSRYKKKMKKYPTTISSDLEPSVLSYNFKKYICQKKKIQLVYFFNSNRKAYMAENKIGQIKKLYFQNIEGVKKPKPMYKLIKQLETTLNKRNIYINNVKTNYKPSTINYGNVKKFIYLKEKLDPVSKYSNFIYRSDFYNFPVKLNSFVFVKLNSIKVDEAIKFKKSIKSLSNKLFVVRRLFLYLSKNFTLSPGALCSKYGIKYKKNFLTKDLFFFPCKSLVSVPLSMIKDIKNK